MFVLGVVLVPLAPLAPAAVAGAAVLAALVPAAAQARSANIHIHGTAPEGYVNIRPEPNTNRAPVGRIPEGASPDYDCFTYGQNIGGVPVWFLVNYGGARGYISSYYDDSSYRSEAELTAKYGIPKCGTQPTNTPPPPASIFYAGDAPGDGYDYVSSTTFKRRKSEWYQSPCGAKGGSANFGDTIGGRPVTTLAGFSSGRLGPLYYLRTSPSRGAKITRIVLFDPGNKSDLSVCDPGASQTYADWLRRVPSAKLIILAGARTGENRHQGIQDIYFAPAIRGTAVAKRVIVCNLAGWSHQDVVRGYQHFAGNPPDSCPREYVQWSP
jgi:uncharacterized protein YraI